MKKQVFVGTEVQKDGSVRFSKTSNTIGPHSTTVRAEMDFDAVSDDWHWPYTEEDFSNGWVPTQAVTYLEERNKKPIGKALNPKIYYDIDHYEEKHEQAITFSVH